MVWLQHEQIHSSSDSLILSWRGEGLMRQLRLGKGKTYFSVTWPLKSSEVIQRPKALINKLDNLSSIPKPHMVERTNFHKLSPALYRHAILLTK